MIGGMKTSATRLSAARWAELVAAWEESGRTALSFAGEHGIAESSLRWWKTELSRRARKEAARRSPGPRRPGGPTVGLARVVREGAEAPTTDGGARHVSIVIGEARIVVEAGFDGRLLREVVQALGELR
jgi:transposase-like protein